MLARGRLPAERIVMTPYRHSNYYLFGVRLTLELTITISDCESDVSEDDLFSQRCYFPRRQSNMKRPLDVYELIEEGLLQADPPIDASQTSSLRPSPTSAVVSRQTLPKGQAAKTLVKRNHALTQRRQLDAARRTLMETALGASHNNAVPAPLTPLVRRAQSSVVQKKSKKLSRQGCSKSNAAIHAATAPRRAVTRRHKMVVCHAGSNNDRKCNNIRC
jgi:hypothetical protein